YDIHKIKLSKLINIHNDNIILSSISTDFTIQNISSKKIYFDNSIFFLKKNMLENIFKINLHNIAIVTDDNYY